MHGSLSNYAADRRVCVHSSAPVDVDAVLHKIFTQDRQKLLHYLVSRLGDQDDAEDVFSDFAFRVVRKVGGLKDAKALNSWLRLVLRSTLIDHIRRQTANHCVTIDIEDMAESAASYTQNEDSVASDDVAKCIDMVMPALQKDYADILRRVDLHEQPRDKVAEALNMSVGNVRVKLHRARRALKTALESYCNERCWENGCECTCLRCGM